MSYSSVVLSDNPIRFYRMGDSGTTAIDAGSQAQNGTLHGGVTTGQTGIIRGDVTTSMLFDGSTGYVSLPTTGLPSGASIWSIEAWVKVTAFTGDYKAIMGFGTNAGHQMATIFVMNDGRYMFSPSGDDFSTGPSDVLLNVPVHLSATFDGTLCTLYVNGVSSSTHSYTAGSALNITLSFADIGAEGAGPSDFITGVIGAVALYNTTLSTARVLAHYTSGITAFSRISDGYGGVFR